MNQILPPPPFGTPMRMVERAPMRIDQIEMIFPVNHHFDRRWHYRDGTCSLWVPAGRHPVCAPPAAISCEWRHPSDPAAQGDSLGAALLRRAHFGAAGLTIVV